MGLHRFFAMRRYLAAFAQSIISFPALCVWGFGLDAFCLA